MGFFLANPSFPWIKRIAFYSWNLKILFPFLVFSFLFGGENKPDTALEVAAYRKGVDVHEEWQNEFKNYHYLSWSKINGDPVNWVKADGSPKWPDTVVRISEKEIMYHRNFLKILGHGPKYNNGKIVGHIIDVEGNIRFTIYPKPWKEKGRILKVETGSYMTVMVSHSDRQTLLDNFQSINST